MLNLYILTALIIAMKRWVKILKNYTFTQLIYVWVSIGLCFAAFYYFLSFFPQNTLLYLGRPLNHSFSDFLTAIYFSFITLTSTGYGDVIPLGISKLLSIIEIFCGLVVFGFLISKMIYARQQKIIEELYDLSFEEKVNKLRSASYAYRTNISRLIDKIKIVRFYRRLDIITELEANVEGLKLCMSRVKIFLVSENKKKSITKLNEITLNLLFNSLSLSVSSLIDIIEFLNKKNYNWKKKNILKDVSICINSTRISLELYDKISLKDELRSLLDSIGNSLNSLEELVK